MSDTVEAASARDDVPELLESAANRIEGLERELELARARLEMIDFVKSLTGNRAPMGFMRGEQDTLIDMLRNRAKSIKRVIR